MKILNIGSPLPYPPSSGAAIRMYSLLQRVAQKHEVWFATLLASPNETQNIIVMKQYCEEIIADYIQPRHPINHLPGLLSYALAGKPLELKFNYSEKLARSIYALASRVNFDLIQIDHSYLAPYLDAFPASRGIKSILVFHNIQFDQFDRIRGIETKSLPKFRKWLNSIMMRRWEPLFAERFDRCVTVSEHDKSLLMRANPRLKVDVIPNGVDTKIKQPLPQTQAEPVLLFVGSMSYKPNADAAVYFSREILPRIKEKIKDVTLWVVGSNPPPEVQKLKEDGVLVTGYVENVEPYYKGASVCVIPLRAGGGTRLKILEAMALGRPVVSSTIGCEGLDVIDAKNILIADNPKHFAAKTVELLKDQALYQRIVNEARHLVETRYDWDILASRLLQIYDELAKDANISLSPDYSHNN